jgi:hypothetical protein
LDEQVELQFVGASDVKESDAIFNYRRKYLPTQQVSRRVYVFACTLDILQILSDH